MPVPTTDNASAVRLVREFVNTIDVDADTDELATADHLAAWLRPRGLLEPAVAVGTADLVLAHRLREALRAEVRTNHGAPVDPGGRRALDDVAAQVPLRVSFSAGQGPALAPVGSGARAGLSAVLAAVVTLSASGAWPRLKICPADDCQWVFYDESRNRSRRWCSMDVCGNRSKLRSYRARHGPAPGADEAPDVPSDA